MIKRLYKLDDEIKDYIYSQPYFNTYIISDIETFGIETDIINLYIGYEGRNIKYVLMKYGMSFVLFSEKSDEINLMELSVFFKNFIGDIVISGKTEIIKRISEIFSQPFYYDNYFATLTSDTIICYSNNILDCNVIKDPSIESIISIYSQIEEYKEKYCDKNRAIERIKRNILNGRYYGVEINNQLVSIASSSAESKNYAMISEVGTLVDYRNKGLSKIEVSQLCNDLFSESKKTLSIFYNNNIAGKVYNKIGFEIIGNYAILKSRL